MHLINYGCREDVAGKLRTIKLLKQINQILPGEIIVLKLSGDLLIPVLQAIDRGAVACIADCGKTNHGVIAAKELGLPFYIGNQNDLRNGYYYSLLENQIHPGKMPIKTSKNANRRLAPATNKNLFINLGFPKRVLKHNPQLFSAVDGVGFARLEFCIAEIIGRLHPVEYLRRFGEEKLLIEIYKEFAKVADKFSGKRFWIRTDDFSPAQLVQLEAGKKYESHIGNELVSFRGISRSIHPDWQNLGNLEKKLTGVSWIGIQFKALNILARDFPKVKFGVFAPMVHDVSEYKVWRKIADKFIKQPIDYGVMVEVPALTGKGITPFIKSKLIDFMIFGTNDLTALTLGIDRSDNRLAYLFNEENPVVLNSLYETIAICKKAKVLTAIGGAAASRPSLIKKLFTAGIDIFSVNPDRETINQTRQFIYKLERGKKNAKN